MQIRSETTLVILVMRVPDTQPVRFKTLLHLGTKNENEIENSNRDIVTLNH